MNISNAFNIWMSHVKANAAKQMTYKGQYFVYVFCNLLMQFFGVIFGLVIYNVSSGLPGWPFYTYMIFVSTYTMTKSLSELFLTEIFSFFGEWVKKGTLDIILIRPVSPIFQSVVKGWSIMPMAKVIVGMISVFVFFKLGGFTLIFTNLLLYVLAVVLALLMIGAVSFFITGLIFILIDDTYTDALFSAIFSNFSSYPTNIYGKAGDFVLTFVIPLGIVASIPSSLLLGTLNFSTLLIVATVVIPIFVMSLVFFDRMMRRYISAGG